MLWFFKRKERTVFNENVSIIHIFTYPLAEGTRLDACVGVPPVGNFCQLITSFVLRLCIEHTRRIINIVAILELEHEAEINVFVIEGVGDTSVPIRVGRFQ